MGPTRGTASVDGAEIVGRSHFSAEFFGLSGLDVESGGPRVKSWPSKIRIDDITHEHDVIIDGGQVRKRKKKPSKKFRTTFGHTPISPKEAIPWKCRSW